MKGGLKMTKVVVQNGNVDLALKKFKAKVARSGVPSEIKKRKHYLCFLSICFSATMLTSLD